MRVNWRGPVAVAVVEVVVVVMSLSGVAGLVGLVGLVGLGGELMVVVVVVRREIVEVEETRLDCDWPIVRLSNAMRECFDSWMSDSPHR